MTTSARINAGRKAAAARPAGPLESGQPDPRPVTEFSVTLTPAVGSTRVTITLDQPCIIRAPRWAFIDNNDGSRTYAPGVTIVDNRTFYFQFLGTLSTSINIIEVPYQDMQVQNFQGGFVRPGGQWFRKAV